MVSLRKLGTCEITAQEIAVVRAALARHPHLAGCRVDAKKKELVVYEPTASAGLDEFAAMFPGREDVLRGIQERSPLAPVLRFVLVDAERRVFSTERMCYRGSVDGWLLLGGGGLDSLTLRYLQHIGKESFFELM